MGKSFNIKDWSAYARCYDSLNALEPYRRLKEEILNFLSPQPGHKILDAACGTGNLAVSLAATGRLSSVKYQGLDFSPEMVKRAIKKTQGMANFAIANLNQGVPFRNATFNCILSVNTLYAVSDPSAVLTEFRRVAVPGGILALATPRQGYQNGLILKEHCNDQGSEDFWVDTHTDRSREEAVLARAIKNPVLRRRMQAIADFNRSISQESQFHFFTHQELSLLLVRSGWRIRSVGYAYAGQNLIISAEAAG